MGYLIIFPFKLLLFFIHSLIGLKYIAFQVIISIFFIFHLSSLTSYWIVWFSYFTSKYLLFFILFFLERHEIAKEIWFYGSFGWFHQCWVADFFSNLRHNFITSRKRIRMIFVEFLRTSITSFKGTTMIAINVAFFWLIKIIFIHETITCCKNRP